MFNDLCSRVSVSKITTSTPTGYCPTDLRNGSGGFKIAKNYSGFVLYYFYWVLVPVKFNVYLLSVYFNLAKYSLKKLIFNFVKNVSYRCCLIAL